MDVGQAYGNLKADFRLLVCPALSPLIQILKQVGCLTSASRYLPFLGTRYANPRPSSGMKAPGVARGLLCP